MITESEESFIERVCGINGLTSKDIRDAGKIYSIIIDPINEIGDEKGFFFYIRFMKELPLKSSGIYFHLQSCEEDRQRLKLITSKNHTWNEENNVEGI